LSEYKRQIAAGATVAVVVALVLGFSVGAFFSQSAASETSTTTLPESSSTVSSSSPTAISSSIPLVSTTSSTSAATTSTVTISSSTISQTTSVSVSSSSTTTVTGPATTTTTTTSATVTFSTTSTTTSPSTISSPGDLNLELSIGASALGPENSLQLNITEYNSAASHNNVSASASWPASGLALGPCGALEFPFGIAVYQGHYTSQNVTSATPLAVFTPGANGTAQPYAGDCPANPQVFSYDFAPQSDSAATRLTWAGDSSLTTYELSASFSITGYWNSSSAFTAFGKGTYTVLAGDEWGHESFQYFTMSQYENRT